VRVTSDTGRCSFVDVNRGRDDDANDSDVNDAFITSPHPSVNHYYTSKLPPLKQYDINAFNEHHDLQLIGVD